MKNLFLLLFLMAPKAWAQPHLRHAPYLQGCEINCGKTNIGYRAEGAYSWYVSRTCYWKISLGNTWHKQVEGTYESFQFSPAVAFTFLDYKSSFYLNLLLALGSTYEYHKQRGSEYAGWNIDCKLGLELEFFLLPRIAIVGALSPAYYFFENPYGHLGYEGRLGLKVIF